MKKVILFATLALVALSIISCASAPAASPRLAQPSAGFVPAPGAPPIAETQLADSSGEKTADQASAQTSERMIVRTVNMNLEVQDTEKAYSDIAALVAQFKGYVAQTNLTRNSKNRLYGSVTVRIPAESLDAALKQIKAVGLRVLTENSNANDVTDRYTDLNARLKTLEAAEIELRKLMETIRERSNKAEDILAVYKQLTEIRAQIEQLKGQMNVLEKTSTLATVTIQLTPKEDVEVIDPYQWLPDRTAREALRTLVQALQGLGNLLIWLLLFVAPILAVVLFCLFLAFLIVRAVWRRMRKA